MRTEIFLLRHGETGLNRKKVYFGHLDTSMTDLGRASINDLASNFFASLDVIVSSDLNRCSESASIFNSYKKVEILFDKRLRELDFGVFEGRTYQSLVDEFPKESEMFFSGNHEYVIPHGESIQMLFDRTFDVFEEIVKKHEGKRVLLSTHGGPIRAILSKYLSGNNTGYWKFAVDHASLTKLVYEDGFVFLEYMGRGEKIRPLSIKHKLKKGA